MKVVFLSHTAPSGVFRVGSHHLSRELQRQGHDVAHIATPRSPAHALAAFVKLRRPETFGRVPAADENGVVQFVPTTVLPITKAPASVNRLQLRPPFLNIASRLAAISSPDVVFVDQPLLAPIVEDLHPRIVIYRPTDAHYDPRVRAAELQLLRRADGIAATSPRTLSEVTQGSHWNGPTTVIENGVEFDHFSSELPTAARDGVVYLGALDHRFDWDLVSKIGRALPNVTITLAGPRPPEVPQLSPNIRLLGGLPYADAPALLAQAQVGLLPLSDAPGNAGRSPMKYYEYLAAGLHVVARTSPALAVRDTPNVSLYENAEQAIAAVRHGLTAADGTRERGREAARAFSWTERATELLDFTMSVVASGRS